MKKHTKIASMLMLAAAFAFVVGCTKPDDPPTPDGPSDTTGQTDGPIHLPSVITEDMDLQDLGYDVDYIVDNGCYIREGALVTVGPDVTIRVEGPNSWGDVYGIYVIDNAALKMAGTAAKPIRFVGHEGCDANERTWLGITLRTKRSENQWEYVEILNAGSEEGEHPAVWILAGSLAMSNCVIDGSNNSGLGLYCSNDEEPVLSVFQGNTIKNCDLAPISMYSYNAVNCLVPGNTYQNENNYVYFYSAAGITHRFDVDVRFKKLEIPYYFPKFQEWRGSKIVTIDPGVEMLFDNSGLEVYGDMVFKAIGTEQEPIVFRPRDPHTALWYGLLLSNSSSGNVVSHCVLQDGGASSSNSGYRGTSLLYIGANTKLSLTNNLFNTCRYYGVAIAKVENFANVTHSGNQFRDCDLANVHIITGGEYHGVIYSNSNGNMDLNDFPQ